MKRRQQCKMMVIVVWPGKTTCKGAWSVCDGWLFVFVKFFCCFFFFSFYIVCVCVKLYVTSVEK